MKDFKAVNFLICVLPICIFPASAWASEQRYDIDLGAGLSALEIPHYPGASQKEDLFVPFPFIRVRSPYLEIERNELTGTFVKTDRIKVGLTAGGSLPVNSSNDKVREGMPNLDLGLEGGPSVSFILWKTPHTHQLSFDIPVRKAVFINSEKIDPHGYYTLPHFHYVYDLATDKDHSHTVEIEIGAAYASENYNAYFYDVAPRYATVARPEYHAHGGLSSYRFTAGYSTMQGNWYFGGFAKYLDLHDATTQDSPLVTQKHSLYAGVAVAYLFKKFSLLF